MQSKSKTVKEYLKEIPADRKESFNNLRNEILKNLPEGLEEGMTYGMIGYYVPHKIYPDGYHCDPKQPLPFAALASQKNFISFYHMGMYSNESLLKWFKDEFPKHSKSKLDMGKSCVRFKIKDDIPFRLIGKLMKKLTVKDWIKYYENNLKKKKK